MCHCNKIQCKFLRILFIIKKQIESIQHYIFRFFVSKHSKKNSRNIFIFFTFFRKKKLFSKNKGKTEQKMRGFNLDRQSMFLKQTTFEPNA
jgi:hypothetical protein